MFHNNIRERFNRGEEQVVTAMQRFASLAARGRDALLARDATSLGRLVNENFDTRRSIYTLPPWQIEMVEVARGAGATAKFAGSGGAIVGTYHDDTMFAALQEALGAIGSKVLEPQIRPGIHDKT